MKTAKKEIIAKRNPDLWIVLGQVSFVVILYMMVLAIFMNYIGRSI